jgi:hypothetical protein
MMEVITVDSKVTGVAVAVGAGVLVTVVVAEGTAVEATVEVALTGAPAGIVPD